MGVLMGKGGLYGNVSIECFGIPINDMSIRPRSHTPEEFENAAITGHFGFTFEEISVRKNHMSIVSEKLSFQNVFCLH